MAVPILCHNNYIKCMSVPLLCWIINIVLDHQYCVRLTILC